MFAHLALPRLREWLDDDTLQIGGIAASANGFSAQTIIAMLHSNINDVRDVVLRFEHPGTEIFLGTDIAIQAATAKALAHHGVAAPTVVGIQTSHDGERRFMAMERAPGRGFPQSPNYLLAGWVKEQIGRASCRERVCPYV